MQINPQVVLARNWLRPGPHTKPQQNGIDLAVRDKCWIARGFVGKDIPCEETVAIPKDVFALIVIRSTYARKGCFLSCGVYDSGYCGGVGVSILNQSGEDLFLPAGERIAQMIFYKGECAELYNGQYQNQLK